MSRAPSLTIAAVALLLACLRHPPPAGSSADLADAAPVARAAPAASALPAPLARGAHDYRGTLGPTAIAMHLVIAADAVTGTYVYRTVGHSIALTGTVDVAGVVRLAESVAGKSTGSFILDPGVASGLDGRWSTVDGGKTFDVNVSPGEPWGGVGLRAEECLRDPTCPAAEASHLLLEADDDHEPDASCFRFLDGAGTPRDVVRARACLERGPSHASCGDGSSAGLDLAELALMHIDGVGGVVDLAGARAMLAPCFDDVTKSGVLDHATARERDPKTPPMNFCKDYGGTTLTSNDCAARARTVEETGEDLQAKLVASRLDEAGKTLFAAAGKAYAGYVDAMGSEAYAAYAEGSIRNAVALEREKELLALRTKDLAGFSHFTAKAASPADVASAQTRARACGDASDPTPEEKAAHPKTEETWAAYRDAEVVLYVHAFGEAQGADRVRAALLVLLESQRTKECAPPSLAPP